MQKMTYLKDTKNDLFKIQKDVKKMQNQKDVIPKSCKKDVKRC